MTSASCFKLYLDLTSDSPVLALFDAQGLNLIKEIPLVAKKQSEVIHQTLFQLKVDYRFHWENVVIVFVNGPGSYTGMRLAEGIRQTYAYLYPDQCYAIHLGQIPGWCGIEESLYRADAFKGETYLAHYRGSEEISAKLYRERIDDLKDLPLFTSSSQLFELIKKNSNQFFAKIECEKPQKVSYYFRSEEVEFPSHVKK